MATLPLPIFLACLELGLHVNQHELIPCFSCELAEMRHVSLPNKGEPGAITRLYMFWTIWLSPGASGARGTTNASDYLHVLVLSSRNAKEPIEQRNKSWLLFHLAPGDSLALWSHCSLTKNSFLYSFFKGGLWITSAPDCEAWWLELNTQSAGTQRCPAVSCVSVLFLQPDSESKVPTKYKGDCNSLNALQSPRSIWSIKEGTHWFHPG